MFGEQRKKYIRDCNWRKTLDLSHRTSKGKQQIKQGKQTQKQYEPVTNQ